MSLIRKGHAWVYGDKVDTDLLAPGAYMKSSLAELATHCLEAIDPHFASTVKAGDILVGGAGFGMGSSREQAAEALVHLGIGAVIAKSFARIFYRNALNLGLPLIICDHGDGIRKNDLVRVDASTGVIHNLTRGTTLHGAPLPDFLIRMIEAGGLMAQLETELHTKAVA